MRAALVLIAAVLALAAAPAPAALAVDGLGPGPGLPTARKVVIGHSVLGHRITAYRVGDRDAPRKALIVGNTHGDEPQGLRVTRAIRAMEIPSDIDLWVIDTINPDGLRAFRRQNAHGVDLNRNFGAGWRRTGPPGSRYYAGKRAFTEPESRAVRDLATRLRPAVSIWYHQPYGYVVPPLGGADLGIVRDYARLTHNAVRIPPGPRDPGQAPTWENTAIDGSSAFIVELPATARPQRTILRHARAAVRVARLGAAAARGDAQRVVRARGRDRGE
jgi:murein peptide amidase A